MKLVSPLLQCGFELVIGRLITLFGCFTTLIGAFGDSNLIENLSRVA